LRPMALLITLTFCFPARLSVSMRQKKFEYFLVRRLRLVSDKQVTRMLEQPIPVQTVYRSLASSRPAIWRRSAIAFTGS